VCYLRDMATVLRSVFTWRMLVVLLMGFSSGLPLLLIGGTLKAWLRQDGVDLSTIGFFSLAGIPYTIKFLWAPLIDRYAPALLGKGEGRLGMGRRRGWLLLTQIALMASITSIGILNHTNSLQTLALLAVLVGFFSASQDIVIDAYRREILKDEELGFGSSLYINGYRLAMYVASAGALLLAGTWSWKATYVLMGALMSLGILTTLFAPEPSAEEGPPKSLKEAVVGPFTEYFRRDGAVTILAFILLYKIGDSMANEMLNPFYIDLEFSLKEIGAIAKSVGLAGTLAGATVGGLVMLRIGIARALWIFGFFQAASTACFVLLAQAGNSIPLLTAVIGIETFTGGMGTAAYAGYMASITNKKFTATQYALLTSAMGVPRVIFGSVTGVLAEKLGWVGFFVFCTVIAIPGLVLLHRIAPWRSKEAVPATAG
jgi:MFS transporter, PAT family, beta-lactamase induction signal transducer AmpG